MYNEDYNKVPDPALIKAQESLKKVSENLKKKKKSRIYLHDLKGHIEKMMKSNEIVLNYWMQKTELFEDPGLAMKFLEYNKKFTQELTTNPYILASIIKDLDDEEKKIYVIEAKKRGFFDTSSQVVEDVKKFIQ